MFASGNPESYYNPVGYMEQRQRLQASGDLPLIDIDKPMEISGDLPLIDIDKPLESFGDLPLDFDRPLESCGDLPLVNLNDVSSCPPATDIEQPLQSYGGSQLLQSWNKLPYFNVNGVSSCPSATDIEQLLQSYDGSQLVNLEEMLQSWNNLPFVNPENVVENCNYAQFPNGEQCFDSSGSSTMGYNENLLMATDEERTTASGLFDTHLEPLNQVPAQGYYFDMGLGGVGLSEEPCGAWNVPANFPVGGHNWEQTNVFKLPQTQCSSSISTAPHGGISTGLQCSLASPQLDTVSDYANNKSLCLMSENDYTLEDAFINGNRRQQIGRIKLNTESEGWNVNRRKSWDDCQDKGWTMRKQ
ncbi:hypothetical protein L211DRAFT_847078 [Terfezia boudieri ATCC MYA-4762]|uniref:Uncharacterized protein n=1 Tax=Terfezia boudieri ATCC MYA-4762 TaxID=1051890 RepID=A0A3N4LXJ9_9PEZI|nr:hypothetical protein L211DRAFT_847078 [Terfezia boudieri ATCC MYA-4762]